MGLKKLIDGLPVANSLLSGGMASVVAYLLSVLAARFGVVIPPDVLLPLVVAIFGIVAHVTPDSLKDTARELDADIKKLAAALPQIKAEYPSGKNAGSRTGKV